MRVSAIVVGLLLSVLMPWQAADADTLAAGDAEVAGYLPVTDDLPRSRRVLIDVRSYHSDGQHDFDTLVALARKRAIDMMVFTEHDRYTIRIGLEPIPGILGYSMEHPSIYTTGVDAFFDDLRRIQAKHPDMGLYGGTESTPGYRWTGWPFYDLALHDAERHLITLGLNRPAQLEGLPSFTLAHAEGPFAPAMVFWGALSLLLALRLFSRKRRGIVALLLLLSTSALAIAWLTRERVDADADFIVKARAANLLPIWTHPGTLSGVREGPMGVRMDTPPYSARVFTQPTTELFAAIYGDTDSNSMPGGLWDRYMLDYLAGWQPHPIWAVAAGDYHGEGEANEYLGNFPMDVWLDGNSEASLLAALKAGHSTGWQQVQDRNAGIEVLLLEDGAGRRSLPGEEMTIAGSTVRLMAAAREYLPQAERSYPPLQGVWIVDGAVAATTLLPFSGDRLAVTELELSPGAHLIRLQIPSQQGVKMVANPFLVRVE